jgi:surface polysaccharide O-acyltransferase-like enzyme
MFLEFYLNVIFCIKIYVLYFSLQDNLRGTKTYDMKKQQAESWFTILMALLIIYLFHPMSANPVYITREMKIYLFIFAILTLIHETINGAGYATGAPLHC